MKASEKVLPAVAGQVMGRRADFYLFFIVILYMEREVDPDAFHGSPWVAALVGPRNILAGSCY